MSNAIDVRSHTFSRADSVFLDTNVWLYLYGPQVPNDWKSRVYSRALADMLAAGSTISVDVLVLSEFVNRFARIEFETGKPVHGLDDFKAYRDSEHFSPVVATIAAALRGILFSARCVDTEFHLLDTALFIQDFERVPGDFNDQVLAELCRRRSWMLVTHDGDFAKLDVTLLTANRRLLASS
jgi:predicted nucleic acid-binding protein